MLIRLAVDASTNSATFVACSGNVAYVLRLMRDISCTNTLVHLELSKRLI